MMYIRAGNLYLYSVQLYLLAVTTVVLLRTELLFPLFSFVYSLTFLFYM